MKVECSQCGHLGPAEEVRPGEDGVEVVCGACGAVNALEPRATGGGSESQMAADEVERSDRSGPVTSEADEKPVEEMLEFQGPDPSEYGSRDLTIDEQEALDRLVPDTGPGIRCPKCAKLLQADRENCERCGLNLEGAHQYDEGEAPWEQPRSGMEEEYERAELLWSTFEENGDVDALDRYVDFVDRHHLYETALRRLRFYLVDHSDHEAVHEALGELASGVQSQVVAARAQAEADAEDLNEDIKRFKRRIAAGIIILGTIAVVAVASMVL